MPKFENISDGFQVTVYPSDLKKNEEKNTVEQIGGQIEELPTDRQIEIINIIKNNPFVSRRELAIQTNVNESAIQKHLGNLKKKGFIEREGKIRGYWKTKNEIK